LELNPEGVIVGGGDLNHLDLENPTAVSGLPFGTQCHTFVNI